MEGTTVMKVRIARPLYTILALMAVTLSSLLLLAGCGSVHAGSDSPTVTIAASPTSIAAGQSSTLTVAATGATTVTITGDDGSSYTMAAAGGTQTVKPAKTTTYTATASGSGGKITATATVTVGGAPAGKPTLSFTANPTTISVGGTSTLTIVAGNATSVTISPSNPDNGIAPTGGTLTVSPAATTTYTVTATNAAGSTIGTQTVTVVPAPPPAVPTVTLSANPTTIVAGASTTLTVVATNATTLTLTGTDGTTFSSPALPVTGGTETVSPPQSATYTVTATGAGGTTAVASVSVTVSPAPTLTIAANPQSIVSGSSSTLTVTATNVTNVVVTGTDGSTYPIANTGGTQKVSPTADTTYTVTANSANGPLTATAKVTIVAPGTVDSINHVIFMLQENHTFDNYFGMLNPYRQSHGYDMGADGNTYTVDGIDDKLATISNKDKQGVAHTLYKLKSTCIDDASSAWSESYASESLGDYKVGRSIRVNGFVNNADGFATSKCAIDPSLCVPGPNNQYTDLSGDRAMGYYDDGFLNYYYFMASQFALSDRWFSPVSSKSIPNRIATFTGGTTQGLTQDPGDNDHLGQLSINTIFKELDDAKVSWKIYYIANNGQCDPEDCTKPESGSSLYPATTFSSLSYSYRYVNGVKPCGGNLKPSSVVGDASNSFCIDPTHLAPLSDATYGYFADLKNGTLPSFAFIESGSGINDEHPGYHASVLTGQLKVSTIIDALLTSTSWKDSVFFFAYDEGGGPYDHVPPVPNHTNDKTTAPLTDYPTDIASISVNADSYKPCVPPTLPDGTAPATFHCDLVAGQPGTNSTDDPAVNGFGAQLGFRVPNFVVSPFAKMHYVSHVPMDHTAIIKFVENRFIGPSAHLTARDAAQPDLLNFFDFTGVPWATPPTPPAPVTAATLGYNPCNAAVLK